MKQDTTVVAFRHADLIEDPLTEIAREGARRMLAEALRAEADAFVARFAARLRGRMKSSSLPREVGDASRRSLRPSLPLLPFSSRWAGSLGFLSF